MESGQIVRSPDFLRFEPGQSASMPRGKEGWVYTSAFVGKDK